MYGKSRGHVVCFWGMNRFVFIICIRHCVKSFFELDVSEILAPKRNKHELFHFCKTYIFLT